MQTFANANKDDISKEVVLQPPDRLLVDGTGLLFHIMGQACQYVQGMGVQEYFLQFAGNYEGFHRACLAYLMPFRKAGIELDVIFDNSIGVGPLNHHLTADGPTCSIASVARGWIDPFL